MADDFTNYTEQLKLLILPQMSRTIDKENFQSYFVVVLRICGNFKRERDCKCSRLKLTSKL